MINDQYIMMYIIKWWFLGECCGLLGCLESNVLYCHIFLSSLLWIWFSNARIGKRFVWRGTGESEWPLLQFVAVNPRSINKLSHTRRWVKKRPILGNLTRLDETIRGFELHRPMTSRGWPYTIWPSKINHRVVLSTVLCPPTYVSSKSVLI